MLAGQNSEVGLSQLEGTVLKHTDLVKSLPTLVSKSISIPDTVLFDTKQIEDLLKTALQNINSALVSLVLLFYFFGLFLSSVNLIHYVFKLLSSGLELTLRSVTNTVRSMSLYFLLDISDFFNELFLFGIQLADIVIQGVVLGFGLLKPFNNFLKSSVHADGFLNCGESLFILLHLLHGDVN